jgi:hypothetical protein
VAIAISVPVAGVAGVAQAAPQSGSQQKAVAQTVADTATLSFILSQGGTDWSAWTTAGRCGA